MAFTTFIGVDLGGGKGKNTAVARLELVDGTPAVLEVRDSGRQALHRELDELIEHGSRRRMYDTVHDRQLNHRCRRLRDGEQARLDV